MHGWRCGVSLDPSVSVPLQRLFLVGLGPRLDRLHRVILETAVGRARLGCDTVRQQDATTLRPDGSWEKQRRQRAVARLNRVRSAFTQQVKRIVAAFARIHAVYPAAHSGQLPFPGSWATRGCEALQQQMRNGTPRSGDPQPPAHGQLPTSESAVGKAAQTQTADIRRLLAVTLMPRCCACSCPRRVEKQAWSAPAPSPGKLQGPACSEVRQRRRR